MGLARGHSCPQDSRSSQIEMLTGQVSTRSAAEQMPKVLSSYSDPKS